MNAPFPIVVGLYNDAEQAAQLVAAHAHELAAVIVEPLQGRRASSRARASSCRAVREATRAHDVLLVLGRGDDVAAVDRRAAAGNRLVPDLTTFGKYVGGGLAFGAFGGRADLLDRFDPSRPDALPHAGTFNNDGLDDGGRRRGAHSRLYARTRSSGSTASGIASATA